MERCFNVLNNVLCSKDEVDHAKQVGHMDSSVTYCCLYPGSLVAMGMNTVLW